jgi:hypothetical protein
VERRDAKSNGRDSRGEPGRGDFGCVLRTAPKPPAGGKRLRRGFNGTAEAVPLQNRGSARMPLAGKRRLFNPRLNPGAYIPVLLRSTAVGLAWGSWFHLSARIGRIWEPAGEGKQGAFPALKGLVFRVLSDAGLKPGSTPSCRFAAPDGLLRLEGHSARRMLRVLPVSCGSRERWVWLLIEGGGIPVKPTSGFNGAPGCGS